MPEFPRTDDSSVKRLKELTAQPFLVVKQALEACGWDENRAFNLLTREVDDNGMQDS